MEGFCSGMYAHRRSDCRHSRRVTYPLAIVANAVQAWLRSHPNKKRAPTKNARSSSKESVKLQVVPGLYEALGSILKAFWICQFLPDHFADLGGYPHLLCLT